MGSNPIGTVEAFVFILIFVIQGESSQVEKLEGGDRGGRGQQKIVWEGEV